MGEDRRVRGWRRVMSRFLYGRSKDALVCIPGLLMRVDRIQWFLLVALCCTSLLDLSYFRQFSVEFSVID